MFAKQDAPPAKPLGALKKEHILPPDDQRLVAQMPNQLDVITAIHVTSELQDFGTPSIGHRRWRLNTATISTVFRTHGIRYPPTDCHTLRHSYATQLMVKGNDDLALVQEARGHRDLRTTRVYTTMKVNPRLVEAVNKAFG